MTEQPSPGILASVVRRYREEELQIPQADFAWLAAVSRGTISNVETGRFTPDARTWHRIRSVLALPPISLAEARFGVTARPVISTEALRGIVAAILAVRDRDPDLGRWTADRWRRLVVRLTREDRDDWPDAGAELTWLARDVAIAAPPEKIGAIHEALRHWGWAPARQLPADVPAAPPAQEGLDHVQELILGLTSSVNEMAEQLGVYRDAAQGFERLPACVQELLTRGQVADYDVSALETVPGVSVIGLVVENEKNASLAARREARDAARRWSMALKVAIDIVDNLNPQLSAEDIRDALRIGLHARPRNELDKLRYQARNNNPVAMYKLGKLLQKGGNAVEAEHWLRRAANARYPGAMFNLGMLLRDQGRAEEAEHWLRQAAEAEHPDAMYHLCALYELDRPEEAEYWLCRAAEARHRDAQFSLWKLRRRQGQHAEADQWLKRAAEAGHPGALSDLGQRVRENGQSDEAERLLRRAAEAGDSGALNAAEILLYERSRKRPHAQVPR